MVDHGLLRTCDSAEGLGAYSERGEVEFAIGRVVGGGRGGVGEKVGAVKGEKHVENFDGEVAGLVDFHEAFGIVTEVDSSSVVVLRSFTLPILSAGVAVDAVATAAVEPKEVELAQIGSVSFRNAYIPLQHLSGEIHDLILTPISILIFIEICPCIQTELALQCRICPRPRCTDSIRARKAAVEACDPQRTTKDRRENDVLMHHSPPQSASSIGLDGIPIGFDLVWIDV